MASFATRAGARDAGPEHASTLKLKGITVRPNGRVSVRISGGGQKQKTLGTFDSVQDAVAAYNAEAKARGVPTQPMPRTAAAATEEASFVDSSKKKGETTRSGGATNATTSNVYRTSTFAFDFFPKKTEWSSESLVALVLDMTDPGRWYPAARAMRRSIHLHVGPTNSGKTHAAVQRLKRADSGVYCSPLRLLAWEVAEGLNADPEGLGLTCDLVTGQERKAVSYTHLTLPTTCSV